MPRLQRARPKSRTCLRITSPYTQTTHNNLTALSLRLVEEKDRDKIEKFIYPAIVPKVLVHLATSKIPQRMGIAYSELIVACLTCLDSGIGGDAECYKKSGSEAAMRFNDFASQSFGFGFI